jgi:hypothetical protein
LCSSQHWREGGYEEDEQFVLSEKQLPQVWFALLRNSTAEYNLVALNGGEALQSENERGIADALERYR